MSVAHNFAFLRGLPFTAPDLRYSGAAALGSTYRILDDVSEENEHLINEEDKDEEGKLKGEFHDDLVKRLKLKLVIPAGATIPGLNTTLAIATTGGKLSDRYNGVWKIEDLGLAWTNNKSTVQSMTLKKCEYLTYTAAAAP